MASTVARVRELLGSQANGKTDEQIQKLAVDLENSASQFYDRIQEQWRRDPESVRWLTHAHKSGEVE